MALKLMYITNDAQVASIAEQSGVDRIFVDMEYIGKADRQGGMDTVQSFHTIDDIKRIKAVLNKTELLVRCNPVHDSTDSYDDTESEVAAAIDAGADIIMLPYFKTVDEVKRFIKAVDGRARTMLLLETPEADEIVDDILDCEGLDEIFIGLNDLSLGYKKKFMFELLTDGTVERLCSKFKDKGIPYGFGGIASLGKGDLPSERVIMEHYRLGSTMAILSRSFCNTSIVTDLNEIESIFMNGLQEIREFEKHCTEHSDEWDENKKEVKAAVERIVAKR